MPRPSKFQDRLAGKSALVTGAGGAAGGDGIGMSIAVLLAMEGASVTLMDRDIERAEYTRAEIESAGGRALAVKGDVRHEEDCAAAVQAGLARFGKLDILVNNVGITTASGMGLEALDIDAWQLGMDVNLKGALLMTRHALPAIIAQGGGAIVNIASIAGLLAAGTAFAYGPSKGALIALSREIAITYGRSGVRSNVICPGHVYTPIVGDIDPRQREARRKVGALGVEGDAWDIAQAVLFLASDESRFITGACLPVDGGVTATIGLRAAGFVNE